MDPMDPSAHRGHSAEHHRPRQRASSTPPTGFTGSLRKKDRPKDRGDFESLGQRHASLSLASKKLVSFQFSMKTDRFHPAFFRTR